MNLLTAVPVTLTGTTFTATSTATPASMVVVLNWFEELKARVPLKSQPCRKDQNRLKYRS